MFGVLRTRVSRSRKAARVSEPQEATVEVGRGWESQHPGENVPERSQMPLGTSPSQGGAQGVLVAENPGEIMGVRLGSYLPPAGWETLAGQLGHGSEV